MALVTSRFDTTGMHCPSCSMLIQMDVGDLQGVDSVNSDHRTSETEVTYDSDVVSPEEIVDVIVKAGYGAELIDE